MKTISPETRVSLSKQQVFADLGGETVILNSKTGIYYGLDEVGARVWSLIQEPRKVSEITSALQEEYEVDADRCEKDLSALLRDLEKHGLIETRG